MTSQYLTPGHQQHDDGNNGDPGRVQAGKQGLENQAHQQQLHHGAQGGHQQGAGQAKPQLQRERPQSQHQQGRQNQVQGTERHQSHNTSTAGCKRPALSW